MKHCAIGIDLGGTNIKGIVMERGGVKRSQLSRPTEAKKGGNHVLNNILELIEELIRKEGGSNHICGVGIGTPGFVGPDGSVYGGAENLPGWEGTQLYRPVMEKFGLSAVAANDVTVAALAEARFGAAKQIDNSVCLFLGTGIGGGLVINGKLYKGTWGMAGELGHIVVETGGRQCSCGLKGCVEQYASATAIVRTAKEICQSISANKITPFATLVRQNPDSISCKLVYDYVAQQDAVALKVNELACDMLARAIGIILNALAPDLIVLGGGVLNAGRIIVDTVKKYVPNCCWPQIWEKADIVIAKLGDSAGAIGAAELVFEEIAPK